MERLRVVFGDVVAVDDVSFAVPPGTVVGLAGPNGCGKTTTIRSIVGLVEPASGAVLVEGVRAGTLTARGCVAYVPDEPSGLEELSIDEWTDLVARLWRAGEGFARRREVLLRAFGLAAQRHVQVGSLSHGRRRLVAAVAAVALDRPTLLVDEATAALDPEATHVLREVLAAVASRGAAVVVATQDLAFVEAVCDRVVLLVDGAVAAAGSQADLRTRFRSASLADVFGAATGAAERLQEVRGALRDL